MATESVIWDTDVMIDYWNINNLRHSSTKHVIDNIIGIDNVVLSAITQMELLIGAGDKAELTRIKKKLHRFDVALINDKISKTAIELLSPYKLSHGLVIPDALIAATCLEASLKLFTHNVKDYKFITRLNLYSPNSTLV